MPGRIGLLFVLLLSTSTLALAQPAAEGSEFEQGKAAMDAHDPTSAIAHFARADGRQARAWLAVALMMESRSPSDEYVERAFEAATQSRSGRSEGVRSRAALAAAIRPGELVITFLVAEQHAYAWAFDRDTLIGYPLPKPDAIATAVERFNAYAAKQDRDGMRRISDEFVPALLGPAIDRVPSLTRVIFVMDGPLRQFDIGGVLSHERALAVSVVDDEALFDEIGRTPPPPPRRSAPIVLIAGAIVIAILISRLVRRRSHARS